MAISSKWLISPLMISASFLWTIISNIIGGHHLTTRTTFPLSMETIRKVCIMTVLYHHRHLLRWCMFSARILTESLVWVRRNLYILNFWIKETRRKGMHQPKFASLTTWTWCILQQEMNTSQCWLVRERSSQWDSTEVDNSGMATIGLFLNQRRLNLWKMRRLVRSPLQTGANHSLWSLKKGDCTRVGIIIMGSWAMAHNLTCQPRPLSTLYEILTSSMCPAATIIPL